MSLVEKLLDLTKTDLVAPEIFLWRRRSNPDTFVPGGPEIDGDILSE